MNGIMYANYLLVYLASAKCSINFIIMCEYYYHPRWTLLTFRGCLKKTYSSEPSPSVGKFEIIRNLKGLNGQVLTCDTSLSIFRIFGYLKFKNRI